MNQTYQTLYSILQHARVYALAHKFISGSTAVIALIALWYAYGVVTAPSTAPRYILTTVATGTVVASLSESGQVSAAHQLALSPKASGTVVEVYVKPGDHVRAGQLIAQLDASDALASLRDAELSLEAAQITYDQTVAPSALALNLLSAKNGVTTADVAQSKARDAAYASLDTIYSDLAAIISGLDATLHNSNVSGRTYQQNLDAYADLVSTYDSSIGVYRNAAASAYTDATTAYQLALSRYQALSRTASNDELVAEADLTYHTVQSIASAVKNAHDFFNRVSNDYSLYTLTSSSGTLATLLASITGYATTANSDLSNSLSIKTNIILAEQSLAVAQNSLADAEGGSGTLTVKSATLALERAKQSLANARQTVANYSVYAPFAGTIASVGVKRYDQAGSGISAAVLITDNQEAAISVNEVDVAKLAEGLKATLTFDALPDLSIAGTVSSVNSAGSVSQGVVTYSATITFDTDNPTVKPGMSVNANIVTAAKANVLTVPASAVKSQGGASYVEVFNPPLNTSGASNAQGVQTDQTPVRVPVTTGLQSDTTVEILSGLAAGEQVVVRTTTATASTQTTTPSTGGARNGGFGGGGVIRL